MGKDDDNTRSGQMKRAVRFALDKGVMAMPVLNETAIKLRHRPETGRISEVDLRKNIERIQRECDPISFLASVVNGVPVPTLVVTGKGEDGEPVIEVEYVTAPISQRISVARELLGKYMPKLSIVKDITQQADPRLENQSDHANGSFAAIVARAALNRDYLEEENPDEPVKEAADLEWSPPDVDKRSKLWKSKGVANNIEEAEDVEIDYGSNAAPVSL